VAIAAAYYPLAFFFCLDREHRLLALRWLTRRSKTFAAA
jgi:DUF1365 family protein